MTNEEFMGLIDACSIETKQKINDLVIEKAAKTPEEYEQLGREVARLVSEDRQKRVSSN